MSKAEILVSGATGRTGGAAIDELLKMGKRVRAYVRSDNDRSAVPAGDVADSSVRSRVFAIGYLRVAKSSNLRLPVMRLGS